MTRIDPPEWAGQPKCEITGVTAAEYEAIQRHRDEMFEVVHREIESYLNDSNLVFDEPEEFPNRQRLTGEYYIRNESYFVHRDPTWFEISIECRCLEPAKRGCGREDDYLGLEVWLRCRPERWSIFEVFRNTDSCSI